MRKRIFLAALAAGALLVAPVAGTAAKQNGDGGTTESKKCENTRLVGFKVKGTFVDDTATGLTVLVTHANRHARDWLGDTLPTSVSFEFDGDEKFKFIGLSDFKDAEEDDLVKLKAKLDVAKHGCEELADAVPNVKKVKVKRPNDNGTD